MKVGEETRDDATAGKAFDGSAGEHGHEYATAAPATKADSSAEDIESKCIDMLLPKKPSPSKMRGREALRRRPRQVHDAAVKPNCIHLSTAVATNLVVW